MDIAYLILGIFILFVVVAVVLVLTKLNQLKGEEVGASVDLKRINTAKDFLPFWDIKDNVIDLGNYKYRAIIDCSSINYVLRNDTEKEIVENAFRGFLNSLQFSVSFFIHTKELNYLNMIENLKKDAINMGNECPNLKEYANVYLQEIIYLKDNIENSKQKKKYIIVPFDEAATINNLSKEEKLEYSLKELNSRVSTIQEGLFSIGIKSSVLDTHKIIDLFFSILHRDEESVVDNISSGDATVPIVSGGVIEEKRDAINKVIEILGTAESKLAFNSSNETEEINELFTSICESLKEIKQDLANVEVEK